MTIGEDQDQAFTLSDRRIAPRDYRVFVLIGESTSVMLLLLVLSDAFPLFY